MTSDETGKRQPKSARGRASTLHVDVGEDLKSEIAMAAAQAGQRPSDWVRLTLSAAVSSGRAGSLNSRVEPPAQRDRSRIASRLCAAVPSERPEIHLLTLQPRDIELLDVLAKAGGFRSRPAALRFALKVLCTDASAASAFKELRRAIPALVDSNIALQSCARLAAGLDQLQGVGKGGSGFDPELRRLIRENLELASRAIGALRPLLAGQR